MSPTLRPANNRGGASSANCHHKIINNTATENISATLLKHSAVARLVIALIKGKVDTSHMTAELLKSELISVFTIQCVRLAGDGWDGGLRLQF